VTAAPDIDSGVEGGRQALSPDQQLAALRRIAELKKYQWSCGVPGCDGRPHGGTILTALQRPHARAGQLPPPGDWYAWFLMSGRGYGKTRSGAEYVKERMMSQPDHRVACIVPDFGDGRDLCIEGESGLIPGGSKEDSLFPPGVLNTWNRSLGEMVLTNGSRLKIFGTNTRKDAEGLRGFQCHTAWFEELGTQQFGDVAWAMLQFALRLGSDPRVVITGTPRPTPLIRELVKDEDVVVTTGTTYDNQDNLPPVMLNRLKRKYEGTNLGNQELYGLLLDGAKGALWTYSMFRRDNHPPDLVRVVVAVDPAGSANKTSDMTGIVVVGLDASGQLWVLADKSGVYSPEEWRNVVWNAYVDYSADAVVGEKNYGGDMVRATIRSAGEGAQQMPVKLVTASRGKEIRATPVVGLYEQKRVIHVGTLADMEQQMCEWVPPGRFDEEGDPIPPSKDSPDRLDALVWACFELAGLSLIRKARTTMHFTP
jgi:phage terminase large subunit-like protein